MGSSNSKVNGKENRVDSFDLSPTSAECRPPATSQSENVVGKRKASRTTISGNSLITNTDTTASPRGKRPLSSSSRASHEVRRSSDSRNFLSKNGIKTADSRLEGDFNGNHMSSSSQNPAPTDGSMGQSTEASAAAQNPYVLPGTLGTIDIAGTNYISSSAGNTQAYGGSYTATSIAHGGL